LNLPPPYDELPYQIWSLYFKRHEVYTGPRGAKNTPRGAASLVKDDQNLID